MIDKEKLYAKLKRDKESSVLNSIKNAPEPNIDLDQSSKASDMNLI